MPVLRIFIIHLKQQLKTQVAIALLSILLQPVAIAQNPTQQEVKAVFIYNFVNFAEWPVIVFKDSSAPFVIGIAGGENYSALVRELVKGETYKGRPIEVRNVDAGDHVKDCHILYIDKHSPMAAQLMGRAKDKPILTIADIDTFMELGGMVRFFFHENKIKIEVNQKLAHDNQLLISAKLLRLAKLYKE